MACDSSNKGKGKGSCGACLGGAGCTNGGTVDVVVVCVGIGCACDCDCCDCGIAAAAGALTTVGAAPSELGGG